MSCVEASRCSTYVSAYFYGQTEDVDFYINMTRYNAVSMFLELLRCCLASLNEHL